jgi:phosphatidylinositol alpha-1,6-mannosyltransferase
MRDAPLRIAFIQPFLFRFARGIERYTFGLANELARQGVEVHLITWNWKPAIQIDELDSRVQVHRLPASRYFAAQAIVPFYARHLRKQQYDFVWIAFAGYGEAEALTVRRKQPFGIVFHYPLAQVPHRYREFNRFNLAQRAAQIVSVSQYVADGVGEFFGRESAVIHHGVDSERFKRDEGNRRARREELGIVDGPLLVTAAALEERKGIQCVLRALPKILELFPETIYLVLGEGEYRRALEELARDLGIQAHVLFLGAQQDVTPFYQAADLSLILSRGEASSLSALESLACEVPVIAARRPPFDELINDDYGLLVNEADANTVAHAVTEILAHPEQRAAMGQRGRAAVREKFSWERAAGEYVKVMAAAT